MPEIKKQATLKITRNFFDKIKDMVLEIRVIAEVEIDDRKVVFEEESNIYNLLNKSVDEIRTEIDGAVEGLTKYVKEKAVKLINIALAAKEHCESKNAEFKVTVD